MNAVQSMHAPAAGEAVELQVSSDMVKRGLIVAPLLVLAGYLIWGSDGAWSTAYAIGLVLFNFLLSALLITLCGFSGWFERVMDRLPLAIAAGMLAGVLLRFGLALFTAMSTRLALSLGMLAAYLLARRLTPRYAVIAALLVGGSIALAQGLLHVDAVRLSLARPVWVTPRFTPGAIIGVAIPLFAVTMASQNVPGVAVIRASGYRVPISPLIGWTGLANLALAPIGGFALNLAAITAAICMGPEAHEDPKRRYVAAVAAGVFYFVIGLFGSTVVSVFTAFPPELVAGIAGLALLATIGGALASAVREENQREAALVTFLTTASGVTLAGIGSAFWGLVLGVVTLLITREATGQRKRRRA